MAPMMPGPLITPPTIINRPEMTSIQQAPLLRVFRFLDFLFGDIFTSLVPFQGEIGIPVPEITVVLLKKTAFVENALKEKTLAIYLPLPIPVVA